MRPSNFPARAFYAAAMCLSILVTGASVRASAQYAITDLGTLGGNSSEALAINNSGQVVGVAQLPDGTNRAFLYTNGLMKNFGTSYSWATNINDQGQVVGEARFPGSNNSYAFLYTNDVTTNLGTLGGSYSVAYGINNSGQVVGMSRNAPVDAWDRAFLWSNGVMTDLGTLGGSEGTSEAHAINDNGQIVGNTSTPSGYRSFLYSNDVMTNLGTLGGHYNAQSSASDINDSGQVVGGSFSSASAPDFANHAYLYNSGTMTDLGTLGGSDSWARAINNSSQIVGEASTATHGQHAFIYANGVMNDINTLLAPSNPGWTFTRANDINDRGQIVGMGVNPQGQPRAFAILTPIFTPSGPAPTPQTPAPRIENPPSTTFDPLHLGFPIRSANKVYLNTEAGGVSFSDALVGGIDYGYYDPFHAPDRQYYSLDLDINEGAAYVVAAGPGKIVHIVTEDETNTSYDDRAVIIYHGNGYFTKYGEFSISALLSRNSTITPEQFAAGFVLGELRGLAGEHLHFQVEHSEVDGPYEFGKTLSKQSNTALAQVSVGGVLLTDYRLNRDPVLTGTINGASDQPRPMQTEILGVPTKIGERTNSNPIRFAAITSSTSSPTGLISIEDSLLTLTTGSPVWYAALVPVNGLTEFISFNAEFTSEAGAEGLLSIYWDDILIGTVYEPSEGPGVHHYTFDLPGTYNDSVGAYTLAFRLDPFTDVQSSVLIDNVSTGYYSTQTIPEPASIALLALGGLVLIRKHYLRAV